jgi:kynurenine aminotransferase
MFEPFFDQYLPSVTFNGGVPVYVPLHPPSHDQASPTSDDWRLDFDELRYGYSYAEIGLAEILWSLFSHAITPKTKMIIVNTPHNPVGKVFTRRELENIANLAQEFNLLVMADEVVCLS